MADKYMDETPRQRREREAGLTDVKHTPTTTAATPKPAPSACGPGKKFQYGGCFKDGGLVKGKFEMSKMDKEPKKAGKEGSKREEAFDRKQMGKPSGKPVVKKAAVAVKKPVAAFKKGGKVKC